MLLGPGGCGGLLGRSPDGWDDLRDEREGRGREDGLDDQGGDAFLLIFLLIFFGGTIALGLIPPS